MSHNPYQSPGTESQPARSPIEGPKSSIASHSLTLGILSLVLGLVGAAFCGLVALAGLGVGIRAVTLAREVLRKIDIGQENPASRGTATAGLIVGIIGIVISSAAIVLFLVSLVVFFGTLPEIQ
jgi:hypothetical protein